MTIGALEINSRLALAPMAGVTDIAFRERCLSLVPELYTVTEMVSSKALCFQDKKTNVIMELSPLEKVAAVQIFGSEPETMARAAEIVAQRTEAKIIDINMGCPIGKIAGNGDGAALMREPAKAFSIVNAVVRAVKLPVTVKIRKGYDGGNVNCVEFSKGLEQSGASAVCVHGRTKVQMYSGTADWDCIAAVKRAVKIPVIANGDINSPHAAINCLNRTGADMVMVGRSAFGNPWVLEQISAIVAENPIPPLPPLRERLAFAMEQFRRCAEYKTEHIACLEARKHLCWYLKGVPRAAQFNDMACKVSSLSDIEKLIVDILRYYREMDMTV